MRITGISRITGIRVTCIPWIACYRVTISVSIKSTHFPIVYVLEYMILILILQYFIWNRLISITILALIMIMLSNFIEKRIHNSLTCLKFVVASNSIDVYCWWLKSHSNSFQSQDDTNNNKSTRHWALITYFLLPRFKGKQMRFFIICATTLDFILCQD